MGRRPTHHRLDGRILYLPLTLPPGVPRLVAFCMALAVSREAWTGCIFGRHNSLFLPPPRMVALSALFVARAARCNTLRYLHSTWSCSFTNRGRDSGGTHRIAYRLRKTAVYTHFTATLCTLLYPYLRDKITSRICVTHPPHRLHTITCSVPFRLACSAALPQASAGILNTTRSLFPYCSTKPCSTDAGYLLHPGGVRQLVAMG